MRVGATSWRKSNHPTKRFGQLPKRSKPRIYPIPHSKTDNSVAIDDAEIAECLADSIETQCSHASPPHDIAHISRIEEEQVLRLVEYVSEGFETERSTVAVFFDVAKAFDRVRRHERTHSTRRLIRAGVPQGSTLSPLLPRTQTMYRDRRRLASNSRYSRTIPRSFTEVGIGAPDSLSFPSRGPLTS
ncbi:hypothetical protein EVAR_87139_1 [Eumeta japonica]|uniref:Uncharacterized protein n=1 Tax=Eumeta variegata TaxID=151549 RepID=A0A4C1VTZ6_EUMVA|nr:hypothetical protein EVAR_87139_1 [Eumeta japonica]